MNHRILIVCFLIVLAYGAYMDALAVACVSHDRTLTALNKFGRTLLILFLPFIGAAVAIASAAETAPQALPGQRWLWPVRFLISNEPSVNGG